MNVCPRGKQVLLREGFDHNHQLLHSIVFTDNDPHKKLWGKAKGLQHILTQHGLWPVNGKHADGKRFLTECPKNKDKPGYPPLAEMPKGGFCQLSWYLCRRILALRWESCRKSLKRFIWRFSFYPKFHYELNFIEIFYYLAEYYARLHCEYSLDGLCKVLPAAIHLVSNITINCYNKHCRRTVAADACGTV